MLIKCCWNWKQVEISGRCEAEEERSWRGEGEDGVDGGRGKEGERVGGEEPERGRERARGGRGKKVTTSTTQNGLFQKARPFFKWNGLAFWISHNWLLKLTKGGKRRERTVTNLRLRISPKRWMRFLLRFEKRPLAPSTSIRTSTRTIARSREWVRTSGSKRRPWLSRIKQRKRRWQFQQIPAHTREFQKARLFSFSNGNFLNDYVEMNGQA